MFDHSHMNLFVILTFDCNQACQFCLFRFVHMDEVTNELMAEKVEKILSLNPKQSFALKLTGGEPFLKPDLLARIIHVCSKHDNVRDIGIGTNGTLPIETFINNTTKKLNIYFSRHQIGGPWGNVPEVPIHNKNIELRLNCNLIKGGVDDIEKVMEYITWAKTQNIGFVCFRELNELSVDNRSMYPGFVYEYRDYYRNNLVKIKDIMDKFPVKRSHVVSNGYDTNHVYFMDGTKVLFRVINEKQLVATNKVTTDVDEYVVHPDGLVTGCWDRDLKRLDI